MLVASVQHVIVDHDALDVIAVLATLVAVAIAVIAVYVAFKARGDLALERRIDFELTLLLGLADYIEQFNGNNAPYVRVRASMLDLTELPWLGNFTGLRVDSTIAAESERRAQASRTANDGLETEAKMAPIKEEIRAAIQSRLQKRP